MCICQCVMSVHNTLQCTHTHTHTHTINTIKHSVSCPYITHSNAHTHNKYSKAQCVMSVHNTLQCTHTHTHNKYSKAQCVMSVHNTLQCTHTHTHTINTVKHNAQKQADALWQLFFLPLIMQLGRYEKSWRDRNWVGNVRFWSAACVANLWCKNIRCQFMSRMQDKTESDRQTQPILCKCSSSRTH